MKQVFRFSLFVTLSIVLIACTTSVATPTLPPGDATRGTALFAQSINGLPSCATCHVVAGNGSGMAGPTLVGVATVAETRVSGQSAAVYLYESIVHPAAYIVPGYGNLMYGGYDKLSAQQLSDLVAYLQTLR